MYGKKILMIALLCCAILLGGCASANIDSNVAENVVERERENRIPGLFR